MKKDWDWERFEKNFIQSARYKEESGEKTSLKTSLSNQDEVRDGFFGYFLNLFKAKKIKYFIFGFVFVLILEVLLLVSKLS